MYVCNCNGVRCRDVTDAIEAGARKPSAVLAHHGHKVCCGRCLPEIAERLHAHRRAETRAPTMPALAISA